MSLQTVDSVLSKIRNESIASRSKDINRLARDIILNEKHKTSRILYAGPDHKANALVLFRLIEMARGSAFLEKVIFNHDKKSVHSTLVSLDNKAFHRWVDPQVEIHRQRFSSINTLSASGYYRQKEEGKGHDRFIVTMDDKTFKGLLLVKDFYLQLKLRNYLRK